MPRYYCHQRIGDTLLLDEEGAEHRDFETAYLAAVTGARDIMCAQVREGKLFLGESIELYDATGGHITTIQFSDLVDINSTSE